ncbi:MAG: hypothetical protein FJX77_17230, partial [Armatimonadetes bacterium]|nr:hypothetical protein [Armatimonadota bacterium]
MVRTARRLRAAGTRVAVLDLTRIGQNLPAEAWYDGLLLSLGEELDCEDELEEHWREHARLGPLQRFLAALDQVLLAPRGSEPPLPLVVFVDEIDFTQTLPFSADEFFAALRECYNRRATDPRYRQLTFCLLGVATPADLI